MKYLLIFLFTVTFGYACEKEQVDQTLPICEELQVSTEESPCKKEYQPSINEISDALNKLGETGTLPK